MATGHGCHLEFELIVLPLFQFPQPLVLDMQLHSLPLLVFDLEDVLLVVLATSFPHEHPVLGWSRLTPVNLGEHERLSQLFFRVVNGIDHLLSVHASIINY